MVTSPTKKLKLKLLLVNKKEANIVDYPEDLIFTPGPTGTDSRVRQAMAECQINPDSDPSFPGFYRETASSLARIMGTSNPVLILAGEGMLGLEASIASLVEPGDNVLCLANGPFGKGLADFVQNYGGKAIVVEKDWQQPFLAEDVENALQENPRVSLATIVHCETPTGLLNPIEEICPLLANRGILSIVDAVASIGGDPIAADLSQVDVVLGGSQKALSAPPGLSFLSLSPRAWNKIEKRKEPFRGFYLNLKLWQDTWLNHGTFPYTQPAPDIAALSRACAIALENWPQALENHSILAAAVRTSLLENGFQLYPLSHFASTLSAFLIPEKIKDITFRNHLWEKYRVQIGGSLGPLEGSVWRLGHMGFNAEPGRIFRALNALDRAFADFNLPTSLASSFAAELSQKGKT